MYVFVVYSRIFLHLFMSVKISMNNLNMHNGQQKLYLRQKKKGIKWIGRPSGNCESSVGSGMY